MHGIRGMYIRYAGLQQFSIECGKFLVLQCNINLFA